MSKMPLRTQHEERVLRAARKYARMKLHGTYIENDNVVHVAASDRAMYAEAFAKELTFAAETLIAAMSIDEVDGKLAE